MGQPPAGRPYMPGYGTVGPEEGSGLLPWSWAEERLTTSHDYWIATAWPGHGPHVMPVWGIWEDGSLWFSSSTGSRKARNLSADPLATATTDNAFEPVVLNGAAERVTPTGLLRRFIDGLNRKYAMGYSVDFVDVAVNACFRLRPAVAFGIDAADFTGSPTRWSFPAERPTR